MKKNKKENNIVNKYGRHGDLLITRIQKSNNTFKKMSEFVLAEGEHTGHKHLLRKLSEQTTIEIANYINGIQFKVSGGQAELIHEEHNQIIFDPGIYEVSYEREYDYFANEIQKVLD